MKNRIIQQGKPYLRTFRAMVLDKTGNTLVMVAAGLIPLTAMIGGGVDASRAYMVKTKLQQACDAGALAGRKALDKPETSGTAGIVAEKFFRANFPSDYLSTQNSRITRLAEANGTFSTTEYKAQAFVTLPTVIMGIFDQADFELTAKCGAIYEVSNSDITMVLDVTGSMEWNSDGSQRSGVAIADQRITSLKKAMKSFYGVVDTAAKNSNARIRYAFVPYVQTVNVGALLKPEWLADQHDYQTRKYEDVERVKPAEDVVHEYGPKADYNNNCNTYTKQYHGKNIVGQYSSAYNVCYWSDYHPEERYTEKVYVYYKRPINTSTYKTFANTPDPRGGTSSQFKWAGCIEERETAGDLTWEYDVTDKRIQSTASARPLDLDIDSLPDGTNKTKWKPYWPEIVHYRNLNVNKSETGSTSQRNCPKKAQLLTSLSKIQFDGYVDGDATQPALTPGGGTYHDVGLLWGARISSPDGPFSTNVKEVASNKGYVSRHMIFMTDGLLDNGDSLYSLYGVERHDGRITGYNNGTNAGAIQSDQEKRSASRFLAICEAVKAKGIRLWVVSFGVDITDNLKKCATKDSWFVSKNSAELNQNFAEIANNVSSLRLAR